MDQMLEKELGFAPGTLEVLRAAFQQKTPRHQPWPLESFPAEKHPAVCDAARIYKRGVPTDPPSAQKISYQESACIFSEAMTLSWQDLAGPNDWIIIDAAVHNMWKKNLGTPNQALQVFAISEHSKDLTSVAKLTSAWEAAGKPHHWCIIGGGVLLDTAGFAAALKGCGTTYIPTTLLAMIDATVGGKTGVNFPPFGKNQLGLFSVPQRVLWWSRWLETLPQRHFYSGMAEGIKTALLIGDNDTLRKVLALTPQHPLTAVTRELISFKAAVVQRDPQEQNERQILNLGHTLGHALEFISVSRDTTEEDTLLHGEAVGLGIIFSLFLSSIKKHLPAGQTQELIQMIGKNPCCIGSNYFCRYLGVRNIRQEGLWEQLWQITCHDKKSRDATSQWVLLQAPGMIARTHDGTYTTAVSYDEFMQGRDMFCNWLEAR